MPYLLADLGTEGSIAVFCLSLCLIIQVKQIMLFAPTHSSLDSIFLPCSDTFPFLAAFLSTALQWLSKER